MITNRLINPTPWVVQWEWHLGIVISIAPDSHYDLTNAQLPDFQPGQPGSENIQQFMRELGVFLRDTDRTYESQALECLKGCERARRTHYTEATNNVRKARAGGGIVDNPEALEEIYRQMGLCGVAIDADGKERIGLREQCERLQFRIKQYEQAVSEQQAVNRVSDVDPDRTLLFTDPPKIFETKFALQVFLAEPGNEQLRSRYNQWREAFGKVN